MNRWKIKGWLIAAFLFPVSIITICNGKQLSSAADTPQQMEQFINNLMNKMTIDEKIGQLNLPVTGHIVTGQAKSNDVAKLIRNGQLGGLFNLKGAAAIKELQQIAVEKSRLGIPLLFGMDVIHGYTTVFPIPLAMSCSWDIAAIENAAHIAAVEASSDGICWTFSPMVDICHDARWGRMAEGSGEDPFLGSAIAAAMVRGYQGDLSSNDNILACVKHFALYGAVEAGREYNTVDMSKNRMFNEYLEPYKAAIDAGAGSVMAAFNTINEMPATANKWLLTDLLRTQWGFKGFVVTDYTAIQELTQHGLGDLQHNSALSLNAGVDMDMVSNGFIGTLKKSLAEGKVSEETINTACRRILEAKYKLGLFSNPYKYCDLTRAKKELYTKAHRAAARKLASESFVLLKNSNHLLPLKRKGNIALIGPLANTRSNMPGTWSVAAESDRYLSLLEGLKETVGNKAHILYAKGSNLMSDADYEKRATTFGRSLNRNLSDRELLKEALSVAAKSDVIVAALGESSEMSGECSSRSQLEMPDSQHALLQALIKTGKPVVLVLFSGRPVILKWEKANVPAILNVWFGGSEAALAIGDVLFGDVNPSGKLTTSFPQDVGQLPYSYNHLNTGRPLAKGQWFTKFRSSYIDVSNDMVYPFGYGLSYTTYKYGNVTLSSPTMQNNGSVIAHVTVTNTGKMDGDEIVQLYIQDVVGSVSRPVKELKGFRRIHLKSGESKQIDFTITTDLLKFYDANLKYVAEPGEFKVMIGPNSEDLQSQSFILE
ncbi:MAG: beta-glucosidase BglX [Bacteroidaceae bacterium]